MLIRTMALSLVFLSCLAAADTYQVFGADMTAGPHQGRDEEMRVIYWQDQQPAPVAHRQEHHQRRPFFNWFAPRGVSGPLPGVMLYHGGGFSTGHPDRYHEDKREQVIDWLTSHGYVVFTVGYTMKVAGARAYASNDARQAIRFIKQHAERFRIDPERLGAWGFSAGGMLLGPLLTMPEGAEVTVPYRDADGKKASDTVSADSGPLADSGISSRLRVMIISSGLEVKPGVMEAALKDQKDKQLPEAIFSYQAKGEKPWITGEMPEDHDFRQAFAKREVHFENYGCPGKHCPSLKGMVQVGGGEKRLGDMIFDFLEKRLKGP